MATQHASVVGTTPNVRGWKGDEIRLFCDIQEQPVAVSWVKENLSDQKSMKANFFDGKFQSLEERFTIDNNFSLVITALEMADEGLFSCQVHWSDSSNCENSTFLTVNSMASKHGIEECVEKSPSNQGKCTYQTPTNTPYLNLTCTVSGFNPNISMLWTDESGKRLNSTVSRQTTLPDDTYERRETITVSANWTEQTFTCTATGYSLNGTSVEKITVLSSSEKRNNSGLLTGLAIGLPLAVVIPVSLLVILLLRHYLEDIRKDSLPSDPPLTEKQVQQCKRDLKAYYKKERRTVTVDPLNFMERVDLDDIYTNLSLIEQSGMRKTPITYEDLWANDEGGNISKRILIQGEGGVGKTTLCDKIAWDWCQGRVLQDLDMVFVIPLRNIATDDTIGGIVKRYLSESNEATPAQIDRYISTNSNKILLVFDGFDEFSGNIEGEDISEVIRILGIEQYESCKVIVTSRPWRTDDFRFHKSLAVAYTLISVEGFNKGNLSNYIKRYFRVRNKDSLADTLVSFIEENDVIRSNMAPFPIYCAMLCLMWSDVSEDRRKEMQKLQTFSEIFGEMISFLKEHYASKLVEKLQDRTVVNVVKEATRAIQAISETALNGLIERKLLFNEEQFEHCKDALETCWKVGILTREKYVNDIKSRHDSDSPSFVVSTVSFPHKLFQEYIAGAHIAILFANDRPRYEKVKKKIIRHYKEFRYLLYFASASRKELGLDIIDGLIKEDDKYFCLDVAFECHTEEAAKAVGKRWGNFKLSRDMSEHTKAGVVFMGNCNQAETLLIRDVNCGKIVSRYLAEGICSSSLLQKVSLENSQLHIDFYMIVGKEASNCQIRDLDLHVESRNDNFHDQSWLGENLARWVCTMPNISRFRLHWLCLNHTFYSTALDLSSSCRVC
ncbi:uncharacterized protein [Diadema setosum]|uniref:uncharacterized protein n=1 Tax=Diadema setosum TaxID=31175 RepID=UPI003B3A6A51